MATRVLEGQWEEIADHSERLAGRRVRLILLDEEAACSAVPAAVNGPGGRGSDRGALRRVSIYGKYAGLIPSTDDYIQEKRRELAREDGTPA